MIPHIQTNTSPENGNCWQTAVACVTDLEPEQVPHFVKADLDGIVDDWWKYTFYWLQHHGLSLEYAGRPHLYNNEYYLVMGYTVRDTYHVCIYRNGKMVHDPHPSGAGLTKELETVVIRNY